VLPACHSKKKPKIHESVPNKISRGSIINHQIGYWAVILGKERHILIKFVRND
jgi:hypothetical protein